MSSDLSEDDDLLSNAIRGAIADAATSEEEEDGLPFDLLAEERVPRGKVPLHRARNLLKLRRVRDGIITGEVGLKEYAETVEEVYRVAKNAAAQFDLPAVKNNESNLSKDKVAVMEQCRKVLKALQLGLNRMLDYAQTQDRAILEEGMGMVEQAMAAIAKTQDLAFEKAGRT